MTDVKALRDTFSDIVDDFKELHKENEQLEHEREELIELLLEIRCYCYTHKPEKLGKDILKYIDKIRKRLGYNHECWEMTYTGDWDSDD